MINYIDGLAPFGSITMPDDSPLRVIVWTPEMIDDVNHLIMEGWPPRKAQDHVLARMEALTTVDDE